MNSHVVNAALVVVSVLLVLAGLETALAVGVLEAHPNQNWDVEYQIQPCDPYDGLDFHSEYGWIQQPGVVFYDRATPAQEWERHTINDEGFRDTSDTGDQGAIVLGDSLTYGYLAGDEDTYPAYLDRWNDDVAFHNYGITSYGPQQYYLVYRDRAAEVDHDLVVVGYFLGNDVSDTISPYPPARPMFELSDGELRQTHEPEPGIEFADYPKKDISFDETLNLTVTLVDGIAEVAAENDAEVLIVTLPRKREVGSETPPPEFVPSQREALDAYAANHSDVHTVHTTPALERAQDRGHRMFGVYDTHPDDYGYYMIARTIQGWLVENDDRTAVDVTADPGPPPDRGILAGVARHLWSTTESYGFLTRRGRLLGHRIERRLGLDGPGEDLCD